MKKRGISAIVATVLIILIVVAGMGIIWSVILPTITSVDIEPSKQAISIDTQGGYTVYDGEETQSNSGTEGRSPDPPWQGAQR